MTDALIERLDLDEAALEAAMTADSKCQQESCTVAECNGFFCHRAIAAYVAHTRHPSRNDVLEEAAEPIADVVGEGSEDLPDETQVTIKIGERVSDFTLNLGNLRALSRALKDRDG